MSGDTTDLVIWLGALFVVLALGFYGVLLLRNWLYKADDPRQEADALYTTAQVKEMRARGLVDERQYEKLMREVREASKRRAETEKRRKTAPKRGLFG